MQRCNGSILVTTLLFGATATLAQVLLLRVFLTVVEENEMVLGIFYASWFLGIYIGAWLAAHICYQGDRLTILTLTILVFQAFLLPLLVISLQTIRTNLAIPAAEYLGFWRLIAIAMIHLALFGFLTGMAFPLLCRLTSERTAVPPSSLAWIYSLESLGSLIAGWCFTFFLAGQFNMLDMALWLAVLVSANALWPLVTWVYRRNTMSIVSFTFVALLAIALATPPLSSWLEDVVSARAWKTYGNKLEHRAQTETRYQRLDLAFQSGQYSLLSNGHFTFSFPDPFTASTMANLILAEKPGPRRILLIGALGRGLLGYFLAANPASIDLVEIDPALSDFLHPWLPEDEIRALADSRVKLHLVDGRWFVKQQNTKSLTAGEHYDLIVCLTPDPTTAALNRFRTREFFSEVRAILNEDGAFVIQQGSAVNYFGPEMGGFIGSVYSALRSAFPAIVATPGTTTLFFASPDPSIPTTNPQILMERWNRLNLSIGDFSPLYFNTIFESGQTTFLAESLAKLRSVPPNTDLAPQSYRYALRIWARLSGSFSGKLLTVAGNLHLLPLIVIIIFFAAAWGVIAFFHPASHARLIRYRPLLVMGTTGITGIAFSILILLVFQVALGDLYYRIGLLVALFMAGLAFGSFLFRSPENRHRYNLIICEAGQAIYALIFLGSILVITIGQTANSPALISWTLSILMFIAGAFSGAEFAIAGYLYRQHNKDMGRVAGHINAADHLGACFGAFATGVILIPSLGITGTLLFIAGVKILGMWIAWFPRESDPANTV